MMAVGLIPKGPDQFKLGIEDTELKNMSLVQLKELLKEKYGKLIELEEN